MTTAGSGLADDRSLLPQLMAKARALMEQGRFAEARQLGASMARAEYSTAGDAANVGVMLARMGMHNEAEQQLRTAISREPGNGSHHYNLATVLRSRGDLEGAEACLDRSIELNPGNTDAWSLRTGLRRQTPERNHVEALREALDHIGPEPGRKIAICYALARELDDLERFDEAFPYLKLANETRRAHMDYDPARDLNLMHRLETVYGSARFDQDVPGHTNAGPIFVIGMPRSGSRIVERILGRHSVVHPAGELGNFSMELARLAKQAVEEGHAADSDIAEISTCLDYASLGEAYIESTRTARGEEAHFVDRLPFNFLYAGIIQLALPKARIVHVRRDPMDTCCAIFKSHFDAAYPFSYDLAELAHYYVAYDRLMKHWHAVMPGVIHDIQYEDFVGDSTSVVRALLDHCDLSWEPQCLAFAKGADGTAASDQQFLSGSIGQWKSYSDGLAPARQILVAAGVLAE
jgi:tetratricopeptide (TPR) repeat protein